jgi:Carboxypeptidase regulatory-like domain
LPPDMPWKSNPTLGYVKGFVKDENGVFLDTSAVTISRQNDDGSVPLGRTTVQTQSDGGGFYGGVDLAPGTYRVTFSPVGGTPYTTQCTAEVKAGQVANFDVTIDRLAPQNSLSADPANLWPPDHEMVTITLSGRTTDSGTGIRQITFRVHDDYGLVEPAIDTVYASGETELNWVRTFELEAARNGNDRDGRVYTIEVTATDMACNAQTNVVRVTVPHDQRR